MRYTTVIDLRDFPQLYKNQNVRVLYLHMALAAGYHVDNLDLVRCSLRQLAEGAGLTLSAVRHGLKVLTAAGMLQPIEGGWMVKKWLQLETAKRPKNTAEGQATAEREAAQERLNQDQNETKLRQLHDWAHGATQLTRIYDEKRAAAAAGDAEAADFCARNAARAEQQRAAVRAQIEKFDKDWRDAYNKAQAGDSTAARWLQRNADKIAARRAAINETQAK